MQLLQCIRRADTGGANTLVNAAHAALYLREIDNIKKAPTELHHLASHWSPIFTTNLDPIFQKLEFSILKRGAPLGRNGDCIPEFFQT